MARRIPAGDLTQTTRRADLPQPAPGPLDDAILAEEAALRRGGPVRDAVTAWFAAWSYFGGFGGAP